MDQLWNVVDLTLVKGCGHVGKLDVMDNLDWLISLIQVEVEMPKVVGIGPSRLVSRNSAGERPSYKRLHDLPAELIATIFEQWTDEDYLDAVMFANADSFLLRCGEQHLQKLYRQRYTPCVGHRLICIGNYAEDLPPAICNTEELRRIACTLSLGPCSGVELEGSPGQSRCSSPAESELSSNSSPTPEPRPSADDVQESQDPALIQEIAYQLGECPDNFMYHRWRKWYDFYSSIHCLKHTAEETVWVWLRPPPMKKGVLVLRNLSKRVFVRSDTFSEMMVGTTRHAYLGRVLLYHICWSSDPDLSMAYNGEIHRGEWAGDQFDVVSLKNFVIELPTWKDVTTSVASTMREIWGSENEQEWKIRWKSSCSYDIRL